MAGIYIHIPFCKSRCVYCDFYSTTSLALGQRYVDALCREMEDRCKMEDGRGEMSDVWFDLSGRKLSTPPTKPGLYIYNGKKTVIK